MQRRERSDCILLGTEQASGKLARMRELHAIQWTEEHFLLQHHWNGQVRENGANQ